MNTKLFSVTLMAAFLSVTVAACEPPGGNGGCTQTQGDFILTISVEEPAVPQGEPWWVDVELKNQSGRDIEIIVDMLFWPHIPNWLPSARDMPMPQTIFFQKNSVIRREPGQHSPPFDEPVRFAVGGDIGYGEYGNRPLPVGRHNLRYRARFWLRDEIPHNELPLCTPPWDEAIEVWSNTVTLRVLRSRR